MTHSFPLKHPLKLARWQTRRMVAILRWGLNNLRSTPAVLGNAMPKSGSHLIIQVLQGLTHIGPFVNPGLPPVNRDEENTKLTDGEVLHNIQRMRPGDIAYGYINSREPFITALTRPGCATVFVFRDPRDMIVSHVFYATQLHPGHAMHRHYTQTLKTTEERINAAIQGVDEEDAELSAVRTKYEKYLGWLEQPQVLCLRFEDLILHRETALGRLLDYLEERGFQPKVSRLQSIEILKQAIQPRKSGTYRKASPGNWQEHFTPANKAAFKAAAGYLLIRLGYEKNDDW